jgi:murein DD-endopeptidase MepM/ murein hydrolase activator NlpD
MYVNKNKQRDHKGSSIAWLMLAVLALSNIACALSMAPRIDPIFSTSYGGGETAATDMPALIFPTDVVPQAMIPAQPGGELVVPNATDPASVLAESSPLNSGAESTLQAQITPEVLLQATSTPVSQISQPRPTLDPESTPVIYYAQSGDSLSAVSARFGVDPAAIISPDPINTTGFLAYNQLLIIPHGLVNTTANDRLLPDSELIYSPSALDFDIRAYVEDAGGYLSTYQEWLGSTEWTDGWEVVYRIALDNSINPRLLLALLEYQSGWVYGQPEDFRAINYPLGFIDSNKKGLRAQLSEAIKLLSTGYYGWREGQLLEIDFGDGVVARLAPDLNAGTVALQYYFAGVMDIENWIQALDPALEPPTNGFTYTYQQMFGDPWLRAAIVEPIFPDQFFQPNLTLPFFIGQMWSFTGGPHGAWEHEGSQAALDFAPGSSASGCQPSNVWALAAAPGMIIRSENGVVILDLDGDGSEQTGWVLLYLHVARNGRVPAGTQVQQGDLIGHPSCEGGTSTGTHIHLARKFNGEWISAGGAIPFNLSGWIAQNGDKPYYGTLVRGSEIVISSLVGSYESRIYRLRDDP